MNKHAKTIATVREKEREPYFREDVGANASVRPKQKHTNNLMSNIPTSNIKFSTSNSAITLIALIITIIVLLILAGVILNMVIGESGLLVKANKAKNISAYSSAKEIVNMKLMEIETECYINNKEYCLKEIAEKMKLTDDITIYNYYNNETASIKDGVTENLINLTGIVVVVNEYSEYKFLIGNECNIYGVTTDVINNITQKDFINIKEFEKNFGYVENNNNKDELEIKVVNLEQEGFAIYVINNYPDDKDVKYEYYVDNIKMTDKISDKKYIVNDAYSEHKVYVVIYYEDTILKSEEITVEPQYEASPILNTNTKNIINNGFYEDYTCVWGHFALYNAFNNDDSTAAATDKWGNDATGSYIGYDFEKNVEISRVAGRIRMREYSIQYSDDGENWNDVIDKKSYESDTGDDFDEMINSSVGKHRYWRIYVKSGCSIYNWSSCVYRLQFYVRK